MNIYIIISIVIATISSIIATILYFKNKDISQKYQAELEQRATLEDKIEASSQKHQVEFERRATLEGKLEHIEELKEKLEQITNEKNQIEKERAVTEQQKEHIKNQLQEFEKLKKEMEESAKSAVIKSANIVSNKLLEDHKREMEAAKKQSEETTKKTTAELFTQFDTVQKAVASLQGNVDKTGTRVDTILNALKNPASAGAMGEIGLENAFKSFGLEPNVDYIMQYSVANEGKQYRPDAILFLPNDMVMVIDSKASKFIIELAEAPEDKKQEVLQKLAKTMNDHLKELHSKKYHEAIEKEYKNAGKGDKINKIINVMYLPTDTALIDIKNADKNFIKKAHEKEILPVGASGLAGLIYITKIEISREKQDKSQQEIIDGTAKLLESINTVIGLAGGVGRGIKSAADNFEKLSNSINKRLLPRARNIESLGIEAKIPDNLPSYNVITNEPSEVIELKQLEEQ